MICSFDEMRKNIMEWDNEFTKQRKGGNLHALRESLESKILIMKAVECKEITQKTVLQLVKADYLINKIDQYFASNKMA